MIQVIIDGKTCAAEEGELLLAVARRNGIDIPAFCYEEALAPYGACRMCLVEVVKGGREGITTSCTLQVTEGLDVLTESPEIIRLRKALLELYLAQAPRSESIRALAARYGVTRTRFTKKTVRDDPLQNRCILCGLCVRVCRDVMGVGAINYIGRGQFTEINTPFFEENETCQGCGACAEVCPTGAIAIEDIAPNRIMKSWSGTKVPLKTCQSCGRYFAPSPFVDNTLEKLDTALKAALQDLCPDCKRKEMTRQAILLSTGTPLPMK